MRSTATAVGTVLYPDRLPSRGVVRDKGHSQHVLVEHRAGAVSRWTARLVGQVLHDVEEMNASLRRRWAAMGMGEEIGCPAQPRLLLRSVFVDDKHGSIHLRLDLHHQAGWPSILNADEVMACLHVGYGWYEGQAVSGECRVRGVNFGSDGYFDLADAWYREESSP